MDRQDFWKGNSAIYDALVKIEELALSLKHVGLKAGEELLEQTTLIREGKHLAEITWTGAITEMGATIESLELQIRKLTSAMPDPEKLDCMSREFASLVDQQQGHQFHGMRQDTERWANQIRESR